MNRMRRRQRGSERQVKPFVQVCLTSIPRPQVGIEYLQGENGEWNKWAIWTDFRAPYADPIVTLGVEIWLPPKLSDSIVRRKDAATERQARRV